MKGRIIFEVHLYHSDDTLTIFISVCFSCFQDINLCCLFSPRIFAAYDVVSLLLPGLALLLALL